MWMVVFSLMRITTSTTSLATATQKKTSGSLQARTDGCSLSKAQSSKECSEKSVGDTVGRYGLDDAYSLGHTHTSTLLSVVSVLNEREPKAYH